MVYVGRWCGKINAQKVLFATALHRYTATVSKKVGFFRKNNPCYIATPLQFPKKVGFSEKIIPATLFLATIHFLWRGEVGMVYVGRWGGKINAQKVLFATALHRYIATPQAGSSCKNNPRYSATVLQSQKKLIWEKKIALATVLQCYSNLPHQPYSYPLHRYSATVLKKWSLKKIHLATALRRYSNFYLQSYTYPLRCYSATVICLINHTHICYSATALRSWEKGSL